MFAVLYLTISFLVGKEIVSVILPESRTSPHTNRIWVFLPAAFGAGTLLVTWSVYILAWFASVTLAADVPLLSANILAMGASCGILLILYIRRRQKSRPIFNWKTEITDLKLLRKEVVFFALLFLFVGGMMTYTFQVSDGVLYSGYTVYGDYAPHTAMMRSFSLGNNFPTQYPHFGGEDVKYHFMFQFLTGNLEYLGLRIDLAYNTVSTLALVGFFMLLYMTSRRITGKSAAGVLAVVFTVFRSGTSFFRFAWEHLQAGDLLATLAENTAFIGYTPNENWGLWNFNVYLNQRHLAFGLILVWLAIWVFLDWLEAGCARPEKGFSWLKGRLFTKEAWKSRNPEAALVLGLVLGLMAFWNGAALIGGLLILFGFAIFSDGKLDYLMMAAVAVVLAFLQTKIFIRGSALEPSVYVGFLAEDKSPAGILWYLITISGFVFPGLLALWFFLQRKQRAAMLAFLLPAVFAFTISLTPDVAVNHKYIMMSFAALSMFWGWAVASLWGKKLWGKLLAVVLAICMTATGIYDFVVILKDNDKNHRVSVNLDSSLTDWLAENLEKDDLILTPEYSINEVTMSGVMMYLGWPYYAWSAGYDTYYRAEKAVEIYTTDDAALLQETVESEGITYILYEEGMTFESNDCREDVIASVYPLVYTSEDGRIRIYETGIQGE